MQLNEDKKTDFKYCLRCKRKLKNPKYRERGYGAICWKKIQKHEKALF